MLQVMEAQQLQGLSLEELKSYAKEATARKDQLLDLKAKGGKSWTSELQNELDNIVMSIVDVEEELVAKAKKTDDEVKAKEKEDYTPAKGTEKMVHLSIVRGRRFNSLTGKEESPAYTQIFTFAEWQLFKKTYKGLGYTIMAVLHDPYDEAAAFVQK